MRLDLVGRRAERDVRREVERDRHRRHLARVRDAQRTGRRARTSRRRRAEPACRPTPARRSARSADASRLRARHRLHHDPVFVGRREDRRHLLLVERVGQRLLDRRRRHAERQRALPVDVHLDDRAACSAGRDVTPVSIGSSCSAASSSRAPARRAAAMSGPRSVYWYSVFEPRPPMRMLGGFVHEDLQARNAAHHARELAHHLVGRRTLCRPA